MVELRQTASGLPEEHAWLGLSRWGMCWRVVLASGLVGMLGALLLGLIGFASSGPSILSGPVSAVFALVPAPIFGGLIAWFGPWLSKFFPLSQGLLFGVIGAAACAIVLFIADGISTIMHPCAPENGCFEPFSGALIVSMFAGVPFAIMAGVGLNVAIKISDSRRAARNFALLLVSTAFVFAVALTVGMLYE